MNLDLFKSAISHFATGVTVVTTKFENQVYGITINSLSSVSLNPPMILYCIEKEAERFKPFFYAENFLVNILDQKQKDIATSFAKNNRSEWSAHLDKGIHIKGYSCVLECSTHHRYEGGDHKIIVALVKNCKIPNDNSFNPLLYYKSKYYSIL